MKRENLVSKLKHLEVLCCISHSKTFVQPIWPKSFSPRFPYSKVLYGIMKISTDRSTQYDSKVYACKYLLSRMLCNENGAISHLQTEMGFVEDIRYSL